MTDQSACGTLLFAKNGANRPLHQDRQVLRAGDLALEQATQDAMLARARRYLHGWGVVAGFMPEVTGSTNLTVGPGYGVTPLGDELFLPEPASLPDVVDAAVACCGPGPLGCDVVDPEALAAARAAAADVTVTAWLIARPASREAEPRAGVPEDCAHPASTLLPSRRCGGVEFAILCTLPPSHQPQAPDCEVMTPFVCGLPDTATLPLPWETPLGPEANFLVIASLTIAGGELTAVVGARRSLWPVELMQGWIASCLCPTLSQPSPPTPPPVVTEPTEPETPRPPPIDTGPVVPDIPPIVVGPVVPDIPPIVVGPVVPDIPPVVGPVVPDIPPIVTGPTVPGTPPIVTGPGVVVPDTPISPVSAGPGAVGGGLAPLTRAAGPAGGRVALPQEAVLRLRNQLSDSVTGIPGIGAARATALAGIGVTTQGEFLTAPPAQLASALNLPEAKVDEMKEALSVKHDLELTFR